MSTMKWNSGDLITHVKLNDMVSKYEELEIELEELTSVVEDLKALIGTFSTPT